MRDIHEVLKQKEEELARITQEVDALRLVVRLLASDGVEKHRPAAAVPPREVSAQTRVKEFP